MSGHLEKDKAVRFVAKLVQLTTDKKLEWQAISGDDKQIEFQTEIEDRRIRLSRYSKEIPNPAYEAYINPSSTHLVLFEFGRGTPNKTIYRSGIALEFLDSNSGFSIYTVENIVGLSDLYEVVSYATAKVDDLVDAVLARE